MSRFIGEQMHHVKQSIEKLKIRQSDDTHADALTQQYGFLTFNRNKSGNITRPAQYIHLALKTDPETVVKFMREGWRLKTPDLIISVTGGAKFFKLPARLRKAFQLGLVSAAATTNAWIITAGTNAGVCKEVGEAINKYRYKNQINGLEIPCIGFGSWGYTAGKEQLIRSLSTASTDTNGSIPKKKDRYEYGIDALQMSGEAAFAVRSYVVKEEKPKQCALEPNHTHFLLFDDETPQPENILALRADVEMCSRRTTYRRTSGETVNTLIPIIMVLVEGGGSSIQCVCEALESNTPVVVVKNSGRAADLISDLVEVFSKNILETKSNDNIENSDSDDSRSRRSSLFQASSLITEVNPIFEKLREKNPWVDEIRENLCRILRERLQLITIFNFDNDHPHKKLKNAILEAVFNAAKFSHDSDEQHRSAAELRLALAWHNLEYARRAIFTDASISKWAEEEVQRGLVDAIRRGYTDFIELFIEYGVRLDELTIGDLDDLYSTASIEHVLPLTKPKRTVPSREEFYTDYMRKQSEVYTDKSLKLGQHAPRELFFWAIFLDRFDLAVYFCSKTWNQSVAPLYGARLYRKAIKRTLDSETKRRYEDKAKTFDKHAASIIVRCFDSDKDFAVNLLTQPAIAFYNEEPLKVALKANCRAFLASKCVQRHLDNEWFGNINYNRQNINIRIFFCTLFFPLLPIFYATLPYLHRKESRYENPNYRPKYFTANTSHIFIDTTSIGCLEKLIYFYRAPIVRFYYNLIFFGIFLSLFSFVILVDFFPLNIHDGYRSGIHGLRMPITEICLHICIWGIIIEELRQFMSESSYMEYVSEISNIIDVSAILLYLLGFITRFFVNEHLFTISKIVLGIDLILWYVRMLHLFAAYERLGPKLIMIFNTMKDLLFFVCFILIFLFGFSITSWSLIITTSQVKWFYNDKGTLTNVTISHNETTGWSWKLLRDVTNYGVWKVFGQVDLIESENSYSAVAFILAILFVAISNVLLLNVLVALFNVTIEKVRDHSHDIWRYQRYLIIHEFRSKSLLPPPFNTFYWLFTGATTLIKHYLPRYRHRIQIPNDEAPLDIMEKDVHSLDAEFHVVDSMQRESAIAEDFWHETLAEIEAKLKRI